MEGSPMSPHLVAIAARRVTLKRVVSESADGCLWQEVMMEAGSPKSPHRVATAA